ncbi:MAG TPA: TolC family protein [Acidobacteriaceae bacterium]|nr:TolC family protein [Acidobacteriaceae bacterium]
MRIRLLGWLGAGLIASLMAASAAAQISLSSTVALALQNSNSIKLAAVNVQRATAGLAETKDVYIPSFVAGANPGPPSIGYPLGEPSLFNVQTHSLVYSFSQPDYIRAAHAALKSAKLKLRDERDQVTLECALAYVQLNTDLLEMDSLDLEKADADQLVSIEQQRVAAGVDSRMDLTKARITSSQIDIHRLHIQDDVIAQRQKLSHLTGMPPFSFIPEATSIPPAPNFASDGSLSDQAVDSNAGIQAAYANAKSKLEVAYGDKKQNYRPQFGFGAQYSRFAGFENYSTYYKNFSNNNFGAAIQITFPLFDASRRAQARESAAIARRAQIEADEARQQTTEQVSTLRHGLAELRAQQHLAQLQSQLAQEQLQAVQTQLANGSGSLVSAPLSPKDEQMAAIQAEERKQDALKAGLSLRRAQLSLMRAIGTIHDWVSIGIK